MLYLVDTFLSLRYTVGEIMCIQAHKSTQTHFEALKSMSSNIKITRICQFCGESFTARTTVTKYCSHCCSSKAYKQREREKNVEKSVSETVKQISNEIVELQTKDFLSIKETAELLNVSRRVISYAVNSEKLKAVRFGRRVIIRRKDIDQLFS